MGLKWGILVWFILYYVFYICYVVSFLGVGIRFYLLLCFLGFLVVGYGRVVVNVGWKMGWIIYLLIGKFFGGFWSWEVIMIGGLEGFEVLGFRESFF